LKFTKVISHGASFFAAASFLFVALSAVVTYFLIIITTQGAPIEYITAYIFSTILPYLFIGVLSLIVAVISRCAEEKSVEGEAFPQVEPEEDNA
jgi:hypothetical protein